MKCYSNFFQGLLPECSTLNIRLLLRALSANLNVTNLPIICAERSDLSRYGDGLLKDIILFIELVFLLVKEKLESKLSRL